MVKTQYCCCFLDNLMNVFVLSFRIKEGYYYDVIELRNCAPTIER